MNTSIVAEKSLAFAIRIVNLYALLKNKRKEYIMSKQLMRSGTSIGANVREAQNAERPQDFLHKLKIAAKEEEETNYWLLLCTKVDSYPNCENLKKQPIDIKNILNKIIITCKSKRPSIV